MAGSRACGRGSIGGVPSAVAKAGGEYLTHPDPVQSRLAVPDAALLALLGSRDENLRMAEELLDADVHVRGNELTLTGDPPDVAFAERVFTELITLAERGQQVSADAVRRTVEM